MAQILLHGTVDVTIHQVNSLPYSIILWSKIEEAILFARDTKLYATIDLERVRVGQTRLLEIEQNPCWNETFHIYCAHMVSNVVFTINQKNTAQASFIARAYLPVSEILCGKKLDRWLQLLDKNHKSIGCKIYVKVQFSDVTRESNWDRGVKSPKFSGVPFTFFSQRNCCKVTLYQDSHVPNNFAPKIPLGRGKVHKPHRAWEDLFDAINNARYLIYIAGWSVYTEIKLVRDTTRPKQMGDITVGELLKKKAAEGVRVLMLVWEHETCLFFHFEDRLTKMHDLETKSYFDDTEVHCILCPRHKYTIVSHEDFEIPRYAHHQKMVIVDSGMPNGNEEKRRIMGFVGGIDLCGGRYDTQFHSLFRTLNTIHYDDFHQPNFRDSHIKKGGPREPWHDIHSRLEGPIAWDVLFNFEQRWRWHGREGLLLNLRDMEDVIIPPSPVTFPNDRETWNVQLFRSIDGGAVFGFPETLEDSARAGLVNEMDKIIDRSTQDAYINAIRRAKRFIYIENQFFLGSSFGWKADNIKVGDIEAVHLIPKELSLKIISKIKKGERFTVYIVVPMWPEGIPDSESVQAILDWQRRTLDMMYTDVAQALHAKGIEANPKDYLSIFCLGNREVKKSGEYEPEEKPEPDTDYIRAQEARRFMIYVHSNMMIVDDEYIIVGSANINQRSMDGARDSEIAMGAFQPYHLGHKQPPRGQIHGFRMSLWYEHLGMLDNVFINPEDLECVRKVNQIAQKYWDLYSSETFERDLPGHLLTYPIDVTAEGEVVLLPGFEHFPDTKAKVLGTKSRDLPPTVTT